MKNKNIVIEFKDYIWKKKAYWLIPIVVALLIGGALIIFGQSSALSPFIYALF